MLFICNFFDKSEHRCSDTFNSLNHYGELIRCTECRSTPQSFILNLYGNPFSAQVPCDSVKMPFSWILLSCDQKNQKVWGLGRTETDTKIVMWHSHYFRGFQNSFMNTTNHCILEQVWPSPSQPPLKKGKTYEVSVGNSQLFTCVLFPCPTFTRVRQDRWRNRVSWLTQMHWKAPTTLS